MGVAMWAVSGGCVRVWVQVRAGVDGWGGVGDDLWQREEIDVCVCVCVRACVCVGVWAWALAGT